MDRIITSSRDRSSLLSTHKVLRNTYFLLSLTLAFSAITATASTVLMLPSPGMILTLVGMYGLMFLTHKTADKPVGILSAFAFTGFLGYILGQILNAYLSAGMGDVIGMALGGTALVFFSCSAYVLTTRKDMSFLGGMLMARKRLERKCAGVSGAHRSQMARYRRRGPAHLHALSPPPRPLCRDAANRRRTLARAVHRRE